MKQKLVQYFNEALAMENAAVDRNQTRMSETPIPLVKQQLQYHLEQTFVQQDRLRTIITNLDGSPTTAKAALPKMVPMDMDTLSNTVKETAKSLVSSKSKDRVDAEYELMQTKQDAIIENAEIVTYKLRRAIVNPLRQSIPQGQHQTRRRHLQVQLLPFQPRNILYKGHRLGKALALRLADRVS